MKRKTPGEGFPLLSFSQNSPFLRLNEHAFLGFAQTHKPFEKGLTENFWSSTFVLQDYLIESVPMNGTRASGIVTLPSAFWKFSSIAATVLPTARPEPFNV